MISRENGCRLCTPPRKEESTKSVAACWIKVIASGVEERPREKQKSASRRVRREERKTEEGKRAKMSRVCVISAQCRISRDDLCWNLDQASGAKERGARAAPKNRAQSRAPVCLPGRGGRLQAASSQRGSSFWAWGPVIPGTFSAPGHLGTQRPRENDEIKCCLVADLPSHERARPATQQSGTDFTRHGGT